MKVQVAVLMCGLAAVASGCAETDAGITTSIEAQLATDDLVKAREIDVNTKTKLLTDPTVSGLRINVDTHDRVVTLTGTVRSQAEKQRALDIARGVENVVRVEDKLTVDQESR